MEKKTHYQILIGLYNDQAEVVINRKVSIMMTEKLHETEPSRVLTERMNKETLQPEVVTVAMRLKELKEGLELDELRLQCLEEMIAEEEKNTA